MKAEAAHRMNRRPRADLARARRRHRLPELSPARRPRRPGEHRPSPSPIRTCLAPSARAGRRHARPLLHRRQERRLPLPALRRPAAAGRRRARRHSQARAAARRRAHRQSALQPGKGDRGVVQGTQRAGHHHRPGHALRSQRRLWQPRDRIARRLDGRRHLQPKSHRGGRSTVTGSLLLHRLSAPALILCGLVAAPLLAQNPAPQTPPATQQTDQSAPAATPDAPTPPSPAGASSANHANPGPAGAADSAPVDRAATALPRRAAHVPSQSAVSLHAQQRAGSEPPQFAAAGNLIRDGKLYISLQRRHSLALENDLDLAYFRYNFPIAQTDIQRTKAGSPANGVNAGVVQSTQGGFSGSGGGGTSGASAAAGAGGLVQSTLGAGAVVPSSIPTLPFRDWWTIPLPRK